ncbi:hypothetical protein [Nocardia salmonicida]|uniref:hypothetical protein n=1 Tax=Nocardia salmonicida TaxID=53431 RepID=UPI0007A387F2|nr:hypothetical protein [Nocardia salmonicida]MBC7299534.1 hypothetical protein [Nocardia sp.]
MTISPMKIVRLGGGSAVRGTVDIKAVAEGADVSQKAVKAAVKDLKVEGVSAVFKGLSGREAADATGKTGSDIRAALLAAYGPGPRGGLVNVAVAAKGEGKSASTIKRWIAGKAEPKPDNLNHLLAAARKAASTKSGRTTVVNARLATPAGAKMKKYGARLIVSGIQGREGYERDRTVTWDLPPDLAEDAMKAFEKGGDVGLADFMADYANTDNYSNLDDWNVFSFDHVALDEKAK